MNVIVSDLDHYGRGIAKVNNKVVFIENALPNEEVDIEIIKEYKTYSVAKTKSIIKSSAERREAICPYYGECGGCNLMHMNYNAQLEFKKNKVKNILKKYANIQVDPIIVNSGEYNYRNKITLHKKDGHAGFMKSESNEVVDIDECLIAKEAINNYIKNMENFNGNELVIRCNDNNEVISSCHNSFLIEEINGFKFKVDTKSFFQVNNYICSKVFDYIGELIANCNVALDLYSGVGTLSLVASKKANKVYGIEVNKSSYQNALENLKINSIKNVTFLNGKVEEKIKSIKEKVDLVITDPPRSGMDKTTIETILKMKPNNLIYMSCEAITLARDLNLLKRYYDLKDIKIFDMFPNTYHCESIAVLERR